MNGTSKEQGESVRNI